MTCLGYLVAHLVTNVHCRAGSLIINPTAGWRAVSSRLDLELRTHTSAHTGTQAHIRPLWPPWASQTDVGWVGAKGRQGQRNCYFGHERGALTYPLIPCTGCCTIPPAHQPGSSLARSPCRHPGWKGHHQSPSPLAPRAPNSSVQYLGSAGRRLRMYIQAQAQAQVVVDLAALGGGGWPWQVSLTIPLPYQAYLTT